MTKKDKTNLLLFIDKLPMFINHVDEGTIAGYIHGYEMGRDGKCIFSKLIAKQIADKYEVNYSSDGWWGQVERLSKKLSLDWVDTFKLVASEVLYVKKKAYNRPAYKTIPTSPTC